MRRHGLAPQSLSFLIVLFCSIILFVKVRLKKLSPGQAEVFRDFFEELISEQKIPEAISLLERHLDPLTKILRADFPLPRIKRMLERLGQDPVDLEELALMLTNGGAISKRNSNSLKSRFSMKVRETAASMSKMIPGHERSQAAAATTIRSVLLSPELTRYIATNRPYLALRILDHDFFEGEEFLDSYMRELLANRGGPLYFEIKNNQNEERKHLYLIPEENRILNYFLADPKIAEKLGVYKPVGDYLFEELERLGKDPAIDPYNDDSQDFLDREVWTSQFYIAIRFFDIMLSRSLYYNVTWHMWLYYLPPAVEQMVQNYHPGVGIDLSREWPTKYHLLIYESVHILVDLVAALPDIPENQENVILESTKADHENGNIPKSSLLALGACMHTVLCSEKLTFKFKQYLIEVVFRLYRTLRATNAYQPYAEALLLSLKAGGPTFDEPDSEYLTILLKHWRSTDKVPFPHEDVEELERLLFS